MAMSDYLEQALLNHVLRQVAYTSPTALYLALFTVPQDDAGLDGVEVTGGSYARQQVTFNPPFTGGDSGCTNVAAITYTNMPAGTVEGGAVYDALTGGNLLFHGVLSDTPTLVTGESLTINAGAFTLSLD